MVPDEPPQWQKSEAVLSVSFDGGEYQVVDALYTPVQLAVVPVVAWVNEQITWLGTAFAIAAGGLFLTASHVFEEFLADHAEATRTGTAGLYVYWETDEPLPPHHDRPELPAGLGGLLPVVAVSWHPTADLGLLRVSLPQLSRPVTFPTLALHVGLPIVGQRCAAVAYHKVRFEGRVPVGQAASVDFTRQLAVTRGIIQNVHRERRDRSMLTWPCFLTDARYPGGMSGGPVAADDGRVVGVVCSNTSLGEMSGIPETSYATLLAAALTMLVPPGRPTENPRPLVELILEGVVSVTGLEHVDVVERDGKYAVVYVEPE
jgi:S1-C subfamily serine protease